MNFFKKNLGKLIIIMILVIVPIVSFAQGAGNVPPPACGTGRICNPISQDTIQGFIQVMLEGALKIGIPIIALAIIYSGFLFVKAQGNSKELETAKGSLMWTLIGAGILLGAWAIAKLIADTILTLG